MKIYEKYGYGTWREGCGTLRASGGDNGGGSEMLCVGCTRQRCGGGVSPTLTGDHENRVTDYTALCVENAKPPRKYIVRRLTPLECCRLQGFPDGWGETTRKDGFSKEEYRFWLAVRQNKESINGKEPKHYTMAQMLAWYNKLHTDSAEYKMWGNGIALPCAVFVLGGVVEAVQATQYENE